MSDLDDANDPDNVKRTNQYVYVSGFYVCRSGCKFSPEEEKLVVEMQAKLGNKWAKIASCLPGRTDNDVKNFWSTRQKRILRALHRPKMPSGSTDAAADTSDLSKELSLTDFGAFQVGDDQPTLKFCRLPFH